MKLECKVVVITKADLDNLKSWVDNIMKKIK